MQSAVADGLSGFYPFATPRTLVVFRADSVSGGLATGDFDTCVVDC